MNGRQLWMPLRLLPEEFLNVYRSGKNIFMQFLFQELIHSGFSIALGRLLQDFDVFATSCPGIKFSIQALPSSPKSQRWKQFLPVDVIAERLGFTTEGSNHMTIVDLMFPALFAPFPLEFRHRIAPYETFKAIIVNMHF
jgi:hypothetical protein